MADRRGRWWLTAALILAPVVLGSAVSVVLLLSLVDAANARDQIELIKTGLAVGAGTGGAVALLLAGRRQWSTERSSADTHHDATERRITDLYTKAADQLGSDKAAVRLAGLYSLERLAQDTPALRQTIVNLLCAYLRMSSDEPPTQEVEVRSTVQRILATHLKPGESFWSGTDLDLTGAELHLFDLKGAWLRNGLFGGAKFDQAWFDGARFDGLAIFGGASFEKAASFESVHFGTEARFRGTEFLGPVTFADTVFAGPALFARTGNGQPSDVTVFHDTVTFAGAKFTTPPVTDGSVELD